jgi:hypothetical protein
LMNCHVTVKSEAFMCKEISVNKVVDPKE